MLPGNVLALGYVRVSAISRLCNLNPSLTIIAHSRVKHRAFVAGGATWGVHLSPLRRGPSSHAHGPAGPEQQIQSAFAALMPAAPTWNVACILLATTVIALQSVDPSVSRRSPALHVPAEVVEYACSVYMV